MEGIQDLECPICLTLCRQAVESLCCSHAFCKECADELISQNKRVCPLCRVHNFATRDSLILRRLISQIKVACAFPGCEKKLNNDELSKHTQ